MIGVETVAAATAVTKGITVAQWLTAALAATGAAAAVTSAGMSAYSAHQQGKFQSDMAKYQAKLATHRAAIATQEGAREAAEAAQRRRQAAASGLVQFAGNGLLIDQTPTSAPNLWEQDQMAELAREQFNIRRNAELAAWGYSTQGQMDSAQGQMASAAGRLGTASSLIGGVGSSIQNAAAGYSLGSALTKKTA